MMTFFMISFIFILDVIVATSTRKNLLAFWTFNTALPFVVCAP